MTEIRLRYAPSPTGYLHIGGARTALFNYLLAKHYNGKFIVRIEDTDLVRNVADGIASQLDNLRWLKIEIDETIDTVGEYGPYQQTERLNIYRKFAQELIDNKLAYYCFCTVDELKAVKDWQIANKIAPHYAGPCAEFDDQTIALKMTQNIKPSIRMRVPKQKEYAFDDLIRKRVVFASKDISDFIIIKSNAVASYNFAVTIDDHLMKISHVVRGEEHLTNTPKQLVIYEAFNWKPPLFGHLPLIVNQQRKKLSKRDGSIIQFISQYRELGYLPEALVNFFVFLGWSLPDTQELYSMTELIAIFNEKGFNKSSSMFDIAKLNWINNKYIQKLTSETYWEFCHSFLIKEYSIETKGITWWQKVVNLFQSQLVYGAEINELVALFVKECEFSDDALLFLKDNFNLEVITLFKTMLEKLEGWDKINLDKIIKQITTEITIKKATLFMLLRIASTKANKGPQLATTLELLGKIKVINNINETLKIIGRVG